MTTGTNEKYGISDDVRFLTRRLTVEYGELATKIRKKIASITMDKRMDYSQAEFDAAMIFEDYIAQGNYLLAENFIGEQLKQHTSSLLLNLHYAKYLKEIKRRIQEAIELLESILVPSGYDQQVLRLLMSYYIALEIPNYEQAHSYARALESASAKNKEIKTELAQFYVAWSTSLKMKVQLDPLKEMLRQQKYKELADIAIMLLKEINLGTHEWHHLLAQSYFNRWDYESSLHHINEAIEKLPSKSYLRAPYRRLQEEILTKKRYYAYRRKIG